MTQGGGDQTKAMNFVTQVYKNVPILPKDAREASDVFYKKAQGDVLLNYENEVILAAQKVKKFQLIIFLPIIFLLMHL